MCHIPPALSVVISVVDASEAITGMTAHLARIDLETAFHEQYARLARVIARVISDPARAEELAVEVLIKWTRHPSEQGDQAGAWLYLTAVRMGLDELRRQARRERFDRLLQVFGTSPTPEDVRAVREEQQQVRAVLRRLRRRHAELLVLRSHGLSYDEVASALNVNPTSVGTLLARAQAAFRKEYVKRYGQA
jgi:RNA polymerase sigma-70 factor (ECF subfamily)